ncbi:ATPase [Aureococcus anophagefferens]|nr:ATPase [Aureococcus anophagefferens]
MAAIVASVLAGLDEDLQEYIVGLCDDTDDDDDLKEAVAAFVLSSELVEEEDAAEAKAAELLEALGRGKPKVDEAALKKAAQAERLARARAAFAAANLGGASGAPAPAAPRSTSNAALAAAKSVFGGGDETSTAGDADAAAADSDAKPGGKEGAEAEEGADREGGQDDQTLSAEDEERTPGSIVLDAGVERRVLADREALDAKLSTKLSAKDAADCGEKLRQTLERLESRRPRGKKMRELSGGWRVRTNLAAALFARPDLLLLDEPTNHLSIAAVLWLARELATSETWKERIVVTVSHDRKFLEDVCGDVLHISGHAKRLTQTHGSYATWQARRAEQLLNWRRVSEKRQAEVDTLKEYAGHGFRYGGSQSQIKKMQMKAKQASKLEEEQSAMDDEFAALNEDQELPLELQHGGELPGNLIALKDVGFAYPGGDFLFRSEMGIDTKSASSSSARTATGRRRS